MQSIAILSTIAAVSASVIVQPPASCVWQVGNISETVTVGGSISVEGVKVACGTTEHEVIETTPLLLGTDFDSFMVPSPSASCSQVRWDHTT